MSDSANLQLSQMEHERDLLMKAVASMAVRSGIARADIDFSLVQLLVLSEDMAKELEKRVPAPDSMVQSRMELMEKALLAIKTRIAFMGWPAESMWQAASGKWVPDWREECLLIEHALNGTPVDESELAKLVSFPANNLPVTGECPGDANREVDRPRG